MAEDLYVSWEAYHQAIEHLAQLIKNSNYEFDSILCLARGGLRVGDTLCRILRKPLAILSTASYGDRRQQGSLVIAEHITHTAPLGDRLLVVDDMVDSGKTLQAVLQWLANHPTYRVQTIKTAVIWYKAHSQVVPDFYIHYLPHNPWIHQPFEVYDLLSIPE
jgi:hypoxanthine phosphoribosyltransferase